MIGTSFGGQNAPSIDDIGFNMRPTWHKQFGLLKKICLEIKQGTIFGSNAFKSKTTLFA